MFQSTRPCGARPSASTGTWTRPCCFNPRARAGRDVRHSPSYTLGSSFQSTRPCGARRAGTGQWPQRRCFNPRARAGRDVLTVLKRGAIPVFQSTRPCGARLDRLSDGGALLVFQSTRPCGARRGRQAGHAGHWRFNPRARAGRDSTSMPFSQRGMRFQSTRPCGARHIHGAAAHQVLAVSIHAPVRGATVHLHSVQAQIFGFNPRARAGRDARFAATRRARFRFNPRARAGRDISKPVMTARQLVFQSTRPCGARLPSARPCPTRSRFNPRARAARPPTYNLLISMKKTFYFSETCLI